jgi:hypothetical protein
LEASKEGFGGNPERQSSFYKVVGREGVVRIPPEGIQQLLSFPPHPLIVKAIRNSSFHRIKIATMPLQNNWKAHFHSLTTVNKSGDQNIAGFIGAMDFKASQDKK